MVIGDLQAGVSTVRSEVFGTSASLRLDSERSGRLHGLSGVAILKAPAAVRMSLSLGSSGSWP